MLPQGLDLNAQKTLVGVSFGLECGEWVAMLGANGSGKSTLARLANGLLLPNGGEVVADGVSSWQHTKLSELRKLVGLVAQDPDNQIVSTTVFDEVAFGPQNLGWEPERIYAAVSQALAQVNLPEEEFAQRDPNTLSGGEKQRVVVASVLAMEPHYLVLDEPTAMLDPLARAHILEAIATARQNGHGILHITHSLKEASFADRVLILNEGRLVYNGTPEDALGNVELLTTCGLLAEPVLRAKTCDEHSDASLTFNKVSFSYKTGGIGKPVLQDVSLEIAAGTCLVLVGASGSGKSTLLSLAAGLLSPDTGDVLLNGKAPVPGQVGLVFQLPETQLFAQTVAEDILFGPRNLGMPTEGEAGRRLVEQSLSAVGLAPARFKDRSPFSLSGGEERRVALATTLVLDTDFLLLDEPTAGLDARGKAFVIELLDELLSRGKGIVIATHDPELFSALATDRMKLGSAVS